MVEPRRRSTAAGGFRSAPMPLAAALTDAFGRPPAALARDGRARPALRPRALHLADGHRVDARALRLGARPGAASRPSFSTDRMIILGINAYHGDVSAALVRDGELVAAVEEERFRRVKHWAGFPHEAIRSCLAMAGVSARRGRRLRHLAQSAREPGCARRCSSCAAVRAAAMMSRSRAQPAARSAASPTRWPRALGLERRARPLAPALGRASPGAPGEHVLRLAVRRGGRLRDRRLRRLRQHVGGRWHGHDAAHARSHVLPALARPAVPGDHAVPRLPEVRRRVQGDGAGAVRAAAPDRSDPRADPAAAGRRLRARSLVLPARDAKAWT